MKELALDLRISSRLDEGEFKTAAVDAIDGEGTVFIATGQTPRLAISYGIIHGHVPYGGRWVLRN